MERVRDGPLLLRREIDTCREITTFCDVSEKSETVSQVVQYSVQHVMRVLIHYLIRVSSPTCECVLYTAAAADTNPVVLLRLGGYEC